MIRFGTLTMKTAMNVASRHISGQGCDEKGSEQEVLYSSNEVVVKGNMSDGMCLLSDLYSERTCI
jgi:hypothetical protein